MKKWDKTHAITHYAGLALLLAVGGIILLTHDTLTYEGNDIAQAGILIGILGTVATGILGFMSGMVLGRNMSSDAKVVSPDVIDDVPGPVAQPAEASRSKRGV